MKNESENLKVSVSSDAKAAKGPTTYSVGTLTYTKAGLFVLFAWLLWADVCFVLFETIPGLIPLKFKALDAPNWLMALLSSTIPMLLNATICPWVSFKSDRHRGKLGRRMPFILYTAPFLTIALIAIGFSDPLGSWVHSLLVSANIQWSQRAVTLGIIGLFSTMFAFFNMFVGSVFWYLFNDLVPQEVMSRFLSAMRIASTSASTAYSFLIFPHAQTHMPWIFLGGGVLYLVTFTALCLRVKEGNYPPPPPNADGGAGVLSGLKTYGRECFSHRFYWFYYGYTGLNCVGGMIAMFSLFLQMHMGLTLQQIGTLAGVNGLWTITLYYFAGMLADRFHPLRTLLVANTISIIFLTPIGLVWLFVNPSPQTYFYVSLIVGIVAAPVSVLAGVSGTPAEMRIFPKDRYGQFCSANALVRSILCMVSGVFAGIFMDAMKVVYHGSDYAYRYIPVWVCFFCFFAYICFYMLYREWKRLGGEKSFTPPQVAAFGDKTDSMNPEVKDRP